jgi:hypothetical protein
METANNVIRFPRPFKVDPSIMNTPQSLEEVEDTVEVIRHVHIQQTLEQIVPMLFDNLALAGFQPSDELLFLKDGALVVESLRAFMSKLYGMEHPLQLIAENLFEQVDSDGNLEVSENIKIVITNKE